LLVYSLRHELRAITLDAGRHARNTLTLISSLRNTIALDYMWDNDAYTLVWSDARTIYTGRLINDSSFSMHTITQRCAAMSDITPLVNSALSVVEGVAVEWLTRTLYYCDSGMQKIDAVRIDVPEQRTTIISAAGGSVRAIAIDAVEGGQIKMCF
jgi:integrin beta 2